MVRKRNKIKREKNMHTNTYTHFKIAISAHSLKINSNDENMNNFVCD